MYRSHHKEQKQLRELLWISKTGCVILFIFFCFNEETLYFIELLLLQIVTILLLLLLQMSQL